MNPSKIVPLLLAWFEVNARDLPWRRTRDPYAIWVSEIMLQQTQVKTVLAFWQRWMFELPTIRALAMAKPEKIHKLWEGLGYYTRVRNLQKAAWVILSRHDGKFPSAFEDILELPGIGRYTAGAICSIAFNQPRPILDGNVIRVLARLCGIDGNPRDASVNARLWSLAERLVKQADSYFCQPKPAQSQIANRKSQVANGHEFCCSKLNQSLMELGALVCAPRQPQCSLCPVATVCVARKKGLVEVLPRIAPRMAATQRRFVAFVIRYRGKVLVRQRPAGVVNAHLWEFPNIEVANDDGDPVQACHQALGVRPLAPKHLCTIRHSITRYRIRLDVFQIPPDHVRRVRSTARSRWVSNHDIGRLAFASAHKRILAGIAAREPIRQCSGP